MPIEKAHEILSNGLVNAPSEHEWCVAFKMAMDIMCKYQNVLAVIREEYISKADYEVRLKADVIAILKELQLEIEETYKEEKSIDKKWANGLHYSEKIIQQKISSLKEVKDGSN